MTRAKVIVHMYNSIDGKIDGEYEQQAGSQISGDYYSEELFRLSNANANGSKTVAIYAATGKLNLAKFAESKVEYEDWVPQIDSKTWDIQF